MLVPTVTDRIDSAVLAHAGERLRLIANYGTGVDNVDVEAAYKRGITVTNTPGVLTEDTADMTMALILAVSRRLAEGERIARSRRVGRLEPDLDAGPPHLGQAPGHPRHGPDRLGVARRARASASRSTTTTAAACTRAWRTSSRPPTGRASTRCWPGSTSSASTARTPRPPIISSRPAGCQLLQPHAIVVNTSRGEVIDEAALTRLLREKRIAGAGLDVFEHEPAINPRLRQLENVVLLPHMGSATIEGRIDMGEKVIINIKTFADGHRPPDRVLPSML